MPGRYKVIIQLQRQHMKELRRKGSLLVSEEFPNGTGLDILIVPPSPDPQDLAAMIKAQTEKR